MSGVGRHMMKGKSYRSIFTALLLVAGLALVLVGCFGGGDDGATNGSGTTVRVSQSRTTTTVSPEGTEGLTSAEIDALSTFRSKDPFIPQALTPSTTEGTSSNTTIRPGTTSTTRSGGSTGTTKPSGGTTTTKPTVSTTTTAPHVHTLKILSVAAVGSSPAVTFQVDSSVYKDKRVGDVVSTSWGQIKVLDLSTSSKVATLLHGSETLVLSVGQLVYE
jgi:hypothetical protein